MMTGLPFVGFVVGLLKVSQGGNLSGSSLLGLCTICSNTAVEAKVVDHHKLELTIIAAWEWPQMERGTIYRLSAAIVGIAFLTGSLVLFLHFYAPGALANFYGTIRSLDLTHLMKAYLDKVILAAITAVFIANYRAVIGFVRRTTRPTDEQVIGRWYVYRYARKNDESTMLADEWNISRTLASRYKVTISGHQRYYGYHTHGELVYHERDRFNILLRGRDHQQQSLICFQANIPRSDDSRTLGLGVGDDAQYVLSARVYLASRRRFVDSYAAKLIDDATAKLRTLDTECPLLQLPVTVISGVLAHPIPPDAYPANDQEGRRLMDRLSALTFLRGRQENELKSTDPKPD